MDLGAISALAAAQLGIVTTAQLRALGMTARQIERRFAGGALERVHVGVARLAGAPATYESRLVAACLAIGDGAVASHRAAATVHSLLRHTAPPVEVVTDRRRSPELHEVVVHRSSDLHQRWTTVVGGVPVTSVARTIVDLGAVARPRTVEAALDRALGRRLVHVREVRDAMVAVARQGRSGVGPLRPLLDARLREGMPAGVFEARMRTVLRNGGLPEAVAEFTVTDEHGGFIAAVDFAFPEHRLAIEADGFEVHSTPNALADRNVRDRLLAAAGWTAMHFSWHEVEHRGERVAAEIRAALGGFSAR
jgi:very-short-patch-repair endonuclease